MIKSHRRQFVVGPLPLKLNDTWHCQQLGNTGWISHCSDLRVQWATDSDGIDWCLLGFPVQSTTNIDPVTQISNTCTAEITSIYSGWAGRWLLIGDGQVHLDATGLLGCFYGEKRQGETWLSSSPALLSQILESDIKDDRTLQYARGISWYTPPYSCFSQIKRLLASQILDFTSGKICSRALMPDIESCCDYERNIRLLQDALVTTLHNLSKQQQPLWLGLTAGYDSRLMLAIARQAKLNFTTFTRVAGRMSLADRVLPPKLAKLCDTPHIFLRNERRNDPFTRKQLAREHSAGNVSDGDAEPFIMGVRDGLEGISFGGHGFAIASGFHNLRQLPANFTCPRTGAEQIAELFNEPKDSSAVAGMTEWLTWVQTHNQKHLDWRDRFFLEQRQAGWLSSKEQVYDMADLTRFPVLNSARNYSLLLGITEEKRIGSLVQFLLLERLAPELLEYPFNPPEDYFYSYLKTAIKVRDDPRHLYSRFKLLFN